MSFSAVNYEQSCRLCMSDSEIKISIFEGYNENVDKMLPSKILTCLSIQVCKEDPFPMWICHQCHSKIEDILEFRRLCKLTDSMLRYTYKGPDSVVNAQLRSESRLAVPDTSIVVNKVISSASIKQEPVEIVFPVFTEIEGTSNYNSEEVCTDQIIKLETQEQIFSELKLPIEKDKFQERDNECELVPERDNECELVPERDNECELFPERDNEYELVPERDNECELVPERDNECELLYEEVRPPSIDTKKQHTKANKNPKLQCPACKCLFTDKITYNEHLQICRRLISEGESQQCKCTTCKRVFKTQKTLRLHQRLHKILDMKSYCLICKIQLKNKGELICHQAQYHRAEVNKNLQKTLMYENVTCETCGLKFEHKGVYLLHNEFYHKNHNNSKRNAKNRKS